VWRRAAAAWVVLGLAMGVSVLGGGPAGAAAQLELSPASGPPGTEFVVTGTGFAALPVEIRWGGLTGPAIATAMGPAFSVRAVAPDSPPNSVPVLAVVTDGGSVSTSSASFQVTTGAAPAPVETTITTSTTLAQPPATSPSRIPGGESGGSPVQSGSSRGGLSGGVDGGAEGGDDTTNGAGAPGAATAGAGSTATSTVTAAAAVAGETTLPTVTLPPDGAPGAAPTGQEASTAPLAPGDGAAAATVIPGRTTQSAGAVGNPALLFLGLALVFGGGVFLAVRNRHRI
jgi:hypothetical protein